MHHLL